MSPSEAATVAVLPASAEPVVLCLPAPTVNVTAASPPAPVTIAPALPRTIAVSDACRELIYPTVDRMRDRPQGFAGALKTLRLRARILAAGVQYRLGQMQPWRVRWTWLRLHLRLGWLKLRHARHLQASVPLSARSAEQT